jgi:hypothetical protein
LIRERTERNDAYAERQLSPLVLVDMGTGGGDQGQDIRLELGKLPSGGGGGGIEVQIHGGEKDKRRVPIDWRLNGRV